MKSIKGTTLIELLVVLVIGLAMLLAIGAISDIGKRTQRNLLGEASIYNDISYGFKLIQRRAHGSVLDKEGPPTNSWVGDQLITGNERFGVYTHLRGQDFVHLPNKNDNNVRRTILSVLNPDTLNFVPLVNIAMGSADITLSGIKNGILFNMTTYVKSRR